MGFVQNIQENTQQESLGESLVKDLSSPYLNDTLKEHVLMVAGIIKENNETLFGIMDIKNNQEDFFFYSHAMIYLEKSDFESLIQSKKLDNDILVHLEKSNKIINSKDCDWLRGSEPFCRIFDRQMNCNHPDDDESFLQLCKKIQKVIKLDVLEDILKLDPEKEYLDQVSYPDGFDVKEQITHSIEEILAHMQRQSTRQI